MDNLFYLFPSIFGGLLPILVIGGIIWAIVVLMRRRKGGEEFPDPGIGTLKRVYYYGLSFVALMVAATGVILLVDVTLDGLFGPQVLSGGTTKLAWGLALTLVGAPIWYFHWRLADRAIQQFPTEAQALARQVYLYLVLAVSAALAAYELVELLRWAEFGFPPGLGRHLGLPLAARVPDGTTRRDGPPGTEPVRLCYLPIQPVDAGGGDWCHPMAAASGILPSPFRNRDTALHQHKSLD